MLELLLLVPFAASPDPVQSRREPGIPRPLAPDPVEELLASPLPVPAERITLAGRWLDERGAPLVGWTVGLHDSPTSLARPSRTTSVTDRNGRFVFTETFGPGIALGLCAPDGRLWSVREDLEREGREVTLWLAPEERPTGTLTGELVGPDGAELHDARIGVWRADLPGIEAERSGARFRVGPLAPGEHVLSATAEGFPPLRVTCRVEAYAERDVGTLRLEPAGWVRVHVVHPGIELTGAGDVVYTELLRDGVHRLGIVRNGPGAETLFGLCGLAPRVELPPRGLSDPIAPGRYLLRTRDWRLVGEDRWVDVLADATTEVRIALRPATVRVVHVRVPAEDPSIRAWLRVTSESGTRVHEGWAGYRRRNGFVFDVHGLLPGRYRLEARSGSGRTLEGSFEVHDIEPAWSEPLRFDL